MPQMDQYQRSAQVWTALVMAAQAQRVIGYEQLARMTGLVVGPALAPMLDNIYNYCEQKGIPILTSLVISEKTGKPTHGVYKDVDISSAHRRVFVFDWRSKTGVPSVKDFEQAAARGTSKVAGAA